MNRTKRLVDKKNFVCQGLTAVVKAFMFCALPMAYIQGLSLQENMY